MDISEGRSEDPAGMAHESNTRLQWPRADDIQNARQDSTRKLIKKAMHEASTDDWNGKPHTSNNTVDTEKPLASL